MFFALLLENAGIPVPGETVLLFASFLAFDEKELSLFRIIVVAIIAATLGDNIGYWVGRRGGRRLLDRYSHIFHISPATIRKGERVFHQHGSKTIFVARFIFGLRIIAGPLAGVLQMSWGRFLIFNFLGATLWVVVISSVGYLFGENWDKLIHVMGRVNLVFGLIAAYAAFWAWRTYRRRHRHETTESETPSDPTTQERSRSAEDAKPERARS